MFAKTQFMKNIKLLVLFVLSAVTFVSCNGSDDDNDPVASINGRWYFSQEGYEEGGIVVYDAYDHQAGCGKDYLEFLANNVLKGRIYYSEDCEFDDLIGTWSQSNNALNMNIDGEQSSVEIVNLSDAELKLKFVENFEGETYTSYVILTRN